MYYLIFLQNAGALGKVGFSRRKRYKIKTEEGFRVMRPEKLLC